MSCNKFFRLNLIRGVLSGLLLFLMLWLPLAHANAQFAVHVVSSTDPNAIATASASVGNLAESTKHTVAQLRLVSQNDQSFARQVVEYAKVAGRWIEEVQHYTNQLFQFSRQACNRRADLPRRYLSAIVGGAAGRD